jgi:hypothetical protein
LVNIPLEYFETAIDWMRAQPWFDDRLLAVSDASRGGDWRCCSVQPLRRSMPSRPGCRVESCSGRSALPSPVMHGHPSRGRSAASRCRISRRTIRAAIRHRRPSPAAYAPFYRSQLRDARAVERATIPVEKIRGPAQLVSGVDDQMWPSSGTFCPSQAFTETG